MESKGKKLGILAIILGGLFLFIAMSNVRTSNTEGVNSVSLFGYRPVVVITGSMEPEIAINSVSILKYCSIDDIEIGDIVMYYNNNVGINITHRVISIDTDTQGKKYLTTKGDANQRADSIHVTDGLLAGKLIKTFNGAVPYVNFVMQDNGQVSRSALIQLIIAATMILTFISVIIEAILGYIRAFYIASFNKKKLKQIVNEYKWNVEQQCKIAESLEDLDVAIQKVDKASDWFNKIAVVQTMIKYNNTEVNLGETLGKKEE